MAMSRMVLGVHYPSDVAFGIALGAAVAAIAVRLDSGLD
jgi:membrane-associated phospholipid phosphatase